MGISGRNITSRAVFAICIAALLLCSLPHHHHGNSQAVCFNIVHCFHNADDCPDHDRCPAHPSSEPASCHLKIDVAESLSLTGKHFIPAQPVLFLTTQPEPAQCAGSAFALTAVTVGASHPQPEPNLLIIDYIARALPARASTEA